ncbi:MAG: sulfotransferase domain-containing protein [Halarcobacter sp.]
MSKFLKIINYIFRNKLEKEKNNKYYRNHCPINPMHDDIYIVEFPKSGITWLQHILGNIELQLANKNEIITYYNYRKYMPDIYQVDGYSKINRFLDRTFIKSHSKFNPNYNFVIYLMRNPYDVMVSFYNYMLAHGTTFSSFEEFVKNDKFGISTWKSHINSWHNNNSVQKIHFIKYENLIIDAINEIKKLYLNLGIEPSENIIKEALARSSMNNMKKSEDDYKKVNVNYTITFVGKENKISKDDLLTNDIKKYINNIAYDEIKTFYPELLKTDER